ncbi:DUF3786 domain-containing protein [Desulfitobacterium sp. AusDCA]|uniref:DUF3786 domain-containing protein n=1 Tax=Desulfitobacterium sp. AusDCA TaxID=3240383 RepID=UPI003DA755C1
MTKSGGRLWLLKVLPKIPLQIVYYDGDDEFPCEVQIWFDKNGLILSVLRYTTGTFERFRFYFYCLLNFKAEIEDNGGWEGWTPVMAHANDCFCTLLKLSLPVFINVKKIINHL